MKTKRGFSLIDALVVVGILALVASVVIPSIINFVTPEYAVAGFHPYDDSDEPFYYEEYDDYSAAYSAATRMVKLSEEKHISDVMFWTKDEMGYPEGTVAMTNSHVLRIIRERYSD